MLASVQDGWKIYEDTNYYYTDHIIPYYLPY